jgi:hypothetical protein
MKPLLCLSVCVLFAVWTQGAAIEGEITFELQKTLRAGFSREFGDVLKAKCDWQAVRLLGKETLFAGISIKNTDSKPLWFIYSVAFFDKDGKLVGAASSPCFLPDGLEPGTTQRHPCSVYLPQGRYKDIRSYQAILYELDSPIFGKRKPPVLLEDPEPITREIRTNAGQQSHP